MPSLPLFPEAPSGLSAKALRVHERLCAEYGCPIPWFRSQDPLSELVSALLSHRTRNASSGAAFRQLRARFPTWEEVRDAPCGEVQEAISAVTWPEQKAPRIQQVLRHITERRAGELSLDFLAELPVREARDWLEHLPGVGPKSSAATLLFSRLRKPALPVDSHHHRVAVRLGLIPETVAVGPAHRLLEAQLPPDWDAQRVYDNHEALMLHGQRCCFYREPACQRCAVLDLCPTGQARLASREEPNPAGDTGEEQLPNTT
ncbi:MAG TPA: Fe-S cluster assembly protein HesB [Archangium sp.]|nr:Fe-S cluster assembly protein HesB [Archangium sp.]